MRQLHLPAKPCWIDASQKLTSPLPNGVTSDLDLDLCIVGKTALPLLEAHIPSSYLDALTLAFENAEYHDEHSDLRACSF